MAHRKGKDMYTFRERKKDVMRDITHNYEQEGMYKGCK